MNDNGLRVLAYLVQSHATWNRENFYSSLRNPGEWLAEQKTINAIIKMINDCK